MIRGNIIIKPDFAECINDFGMLRFEDEYAVSASSQWKPAANAEQEALTKRTLRERSRCIWLPFSERDGYTS